jgi:cellulose synthase/poly-beta-1,6-N-acetylglucosamine synthase-like glycosyltransferase
MEEYPPVSIIVAAYNAQATIADCVESLLNLDYPEKEIIIVNDGSTDETEEIVKGYSVELISQAKRGASAARNNGLRRAKNEIVAYTDSDCEVSKGWLRNIVKHFKDPEIGAVTGRTVFATNGRCTSYVRSLDIEERNNRRRRYTSLANGPNSAFRRDLLLKIGGFDPKWYHAEDTEVSYKIWKEGYKIAYEPSAVVDHVPEGNWTDFLRKRYRDAKAFTRMLYFHPFQAWVKDDFVTPNMKVQPPLFAMVTFLPALMLSLYLLGYPVRLLLFSWLSFIALGIVLNLPFSYRVYKKSNKASFFMRALLLLIGRGFCWGLGLVVGGFQNLGEYLRKER